MPPRGPSTKRQGVANQRDTRHEIGLVGPGKRVAKQKSNGHLNGHAKTSEIPSTPPLAATPPPTNGHARYTAVEENSNGHKMPGQALRRPSVGGYSDSSSSEAYHNATGSPVNDHHRQIDVNSIKKTTAPGPLDHLSTVLSSLPLHDTIAILIVLLQIPPTFLSIVHLLFATLTFVPPSTTALSGMSLPDILNGTLGTPSIATIFFVDIVVLLVWLFLWGPLQDVALDLAQTVIALTLGGGTSGREAGYKNVLWCFGIISASHLFRNSNVNQSGIRAILSSSSGLLGTTDPDDPLEPISMSPSSNKKHGLIRSILAIHILTQGVVRYIRDWYVRREKRDHSASIGDPEAGKAPVDTNSDSTANTPTPDTDSSTSLPVSNTVTTKKRKKQSAQVRIQQPLWAALASTKIVMVKEYETSHTAAESAGTNATDINNLGDAPFHSEADRIWITYVGPDEVCFSTSFFSTHAAESEEKSLDSDEKRPFYVRVNETKWQPTKIHATTDPDLPPGLDIRWSGEIFGLAPFSNYKCEFISTVDNSIIFSTSIRTVRSPTTDSAAGLSQNPQVTGRPTSPITTLKTSIASAQVKLDEEIKRSKTLRREHRTKLTSVRKDVDKLTTGIANAGGNDDKQKAKVVQHTHQMKQAEEASLNLDTEIAQLGNIPSADLSRHSSSHAELKAQRKLHKLKQEEFNATKLAADREIQALKNEISVLQQKRERNESRINQLNEKCERITDANAKGLDEVQRKDRERQAKRVERNKIQAFYQSRLQHIQDEISQGNAALTQLTSVIDSLQQAIYSDSPSASSQNLSAPFSEPIPESGLPTYSWNGPAPAMYAYAPILGQSTTPQRRGRSSSMLSNVSGFTQSSGEGPSFGPVGKGSVWEDAREERKASSGSGSSAGDPKSPIVGNGKLVPSPW